MSRMEDVRTEFLNTVTATQNVGFSYPDSDLLLFFAHDLATEQLRHTASRDDARCVVVCMVNVSAALANKPTCGVEPICKVLQINL